MTHDKDSRNSSTQECLVMIQLPGSRSHKASQDTRVSHQQYGVLRWSREYTASLQDRGAEERIRTHLSIFASPVFDMAGGRLTRDEQMMRAAFVKKCCTTKFALSLRLCSFPSEERTVWLPEDRSSLEYVRLVMVLAVLDCLDEEL
jgi:hypothetical protein